MKTQMKKKEIKKKGYYISCFIYPKFLPKSNNG